MRCLGALVVAAAVLGLAPSVAGAQGRLVERSSQQLRVQGSVEVEFRGTPEAGCAAREVCDVTGSVSYVPGGQGQLFVTAFRRANGSLRRDVQAFLFGFGSSGPQTIGTTSRDGGQCVDARTLDGSNFDVRAIGDDVRFGLAGNPRFGFFGGDPLRTRCAGPRSEDVLAAIGVERVARSSLAGGRTLDFSANAPFSAAGFAGTVRSSVRIVVEAARRQGPVRQFVRRPSRPRRAPTTRQLRIPLRLVSVVGDASLDLAGDPATCRRLDSCGVTGTTTVRPRPTPRSVAFHLSVRSRSKPAALAAVGLGTGRAASIAFGGAFSSFGNEAGTSATTLLRDGVVACTSSGDELRGGALELQALGTSRRLRVRLTGLGAGASRCPGPLAGDLESGERNATLASGTIPLSALRSRRVSVALAGATALTGPGYLGRVRSRLTVVLERGAVRLGS